MTTQQSISETPEFSYAHFWVRLVAFIIDFILLGIIITTLRWFLMHKLNQDLRLENFLSDDGELIVTPFFTLSSIIFVGCQLITVWLYYALTETILGASPGKLPFKLRITRTDGRRINFARATGRAFARLLAFLPFLTGYLMAAFTEKTQALHDILSDCIVIPANQVITTPVEIKIENQEQVETL